MAETFVTVRHTVTGAVGQVPLDVLDFWLERGYVEDASADAPGYLTLKTQLIQAIAKLNAIVVEDLGTADGQTAVLISNYSSTQRAVDARILVTINNQVISLVQAAMADDPSIGVVVGTAAAAAAEAAVTAQILSRDLVEGQTFEDALLKEPVFSVTDDAGRRSWLEFDETGAPTAWSLLKLNELGVGAATEALDDARVDTLAFAVVDEDERRTDLEVGLDGHFTQRVITSIAARVGVGSAAPVYPLAGKWAHWGDSLTGAGSNGGWVEGMSALTGATHYNGGVGGQGTESIAARNGATPALLDAVNLAPSGPTTVVVRRGFPCSNGQSLVGTVVDETGRAAHGVLARSGDGTSHTFTRDEPGSAVGLVGRVMFLTDDGAAHRADHQTIWVGRNDFVYRPIGMVVHRVRNMIDFVTPQSPRIMVLEVPAAASETTGTPDRLKIDAGNAALRAAFSDYFLDVVSYMKTDAAFTAAGIAKTSQDQADINNGVTPTSFTSDGLHFSTAGGNAIKAYVYAAAQTRGWIV